MGRRMIVRYSTGSLPWSAVTSMGAKGDPGDGGGDGATSVNGVEPVAGNVTITQDNVGDGVTYKRFSATQAAKLAGIAEGAIAEVPAASEAAAGIVELATTAEAVAGTDTARAVTAAGVKAYHDAHGIASVLWDSGAGSWAAAPGSAAVRFYFSTDDPDATPPTGLAVMDRWYPHKDSPHWPAP